MVDNDTKSFSKNKAIAVAFFFGLIGLHNFIWGNSIHGVIKIALVVASVYTKSKGMDLPHCIIDFVLFLLVLVDMVKIRNGSFHASNYAWPATGISTLLMVIFVLVIGGLSLHSLFGCLSEMRLKDSGTVYTVSDITREYVGNQVSADAKFVKHRITIKGEVLVVREGRDRSVEVMLNPPMGRESPIPFFGLGFAGSERNRLLGVQPGSILTASCIVQFVGSGMFVANKCELK